MRSSTSLPSVAEWWAAQESASLAVDPPSSDAAGASAPTDPPWLAALGRALAAEAALRPDEALATLAAVEDEVPEGPWSRVARLLTLRARARRADALALPELKASLSALVHDVPIVEPATSARAWHLLGVVDLRRDEFEHAEEALARALERVEEGPEKTWVLDSVGQTLLAQGAWEEGRKVLRAVAERKAKAGDVVGLAVTAGHWARMELGRGRPAAAEEALRVALDADATSRRLPALSRLRLETMLVEAVLDARGAAAAAPAASALEATLAGLASRTHYLRSFAHAALARVAAARGDAAASRRELDAATLDASAPEMFAHLRTVAASLAPQSLDDPSWWRETAALLAQVGVPTETEIRARLLLAERAAARGGGGDRDDARGHLDAAFDVAVRANHPGWAARVDAVFDRIDAEGASRRRLERWAGATASEAQATRVVDATVVFADLVGYTTRSQTLSPAETLATVRSLFELSMPPMVALGVRPVSYLGDGLLAVAEGDGHARRAVEFACRFVRRAERATLVRHAIGETWGLTLRAGVASGPVALGPLGTHVKMEYTVAGRAANLAARLQSQAHPGEVVVAEEAGEGALADFPHRDPERLTLKGFPEPVLARRIHPGA